MLSYNTKNALSYPMRRRVLPVLPLLFVPASRRGISSGTYIPFRCNRRSCRCLLFLQQRPSETIFHLLHAHPLSAQETSYSSKKTDRLCLREDFSVVRHTHVLFSSTGFSYEGIVTYFPAFVNPDFTQVFRFSQQLLLFSHLRYKHQ